MPRDERGLHLRRKTGGSESGTLIAMRNLGPACVSWLEAVGIRTPDDLRRVGALAAFRQIMYSRSGDVSVILLYALEGALRDERWDRLPPRVKAALRKAATEV